MVLEGDRSHVKATKPAATSRPPSAPRSVRAAEGSGSSDEVRFSGGARSTLAARRRPAGTSSAEARADAERSGRPEVHVRTDGAVVSRFPDGTTVSERAGGETTSFDVEGGRVTETVYEEDGTRITERTVQYDDGRTEEVREAERDGVVDRTVTTTEESPEDLEQLVEGYDPGHEAHVSEGQRGPTQVVQTTHTVTDTNAQPPEERVISDEVRYQQQILPEEGQYEDGNVFHLPHRSELGFPHLVGLDRDVEVDQEASGQFLTATVSRTEEGETTTFGSEQRLVGRDAEGREVVASYGFHDVYQDGERLATRIVTEEQGTLPRETLRGAGVTEVSGYEEFAERLEGGDDEYLDFRQEVTLPEDGATTTVTQVGDYRNPHEDGRTVTLVDQNGERQVSYRHVYDGGDSVDSQTVIPGTEFSSVTRERYHDDGTWRIETEARNGEDILLRETAERRRVDQIDGRVDPTLREEFLAGGDGPIYEESVVSITAGETEVTVTEARQYSRGDGTDLYFVRDTAEDTEISVLDDTGRGTARAVSLDGDVLSVDEEGLVTLNGERVELPADAPLVPAGVQDTRSGLSALNRFLRAAELTTPGLENPIPRGFQRGLNTAGSLFGVVNVAEAVADGDYLGAADALGSAATSLGSFASDRGLSGLARTIRIGGAALNAGLAIYDLAQGRYLDAALSGASALGLGLTAVPGGQVPGLIILGVTGVIELGRLVAASGQAYEHVPLEV